LKDSKNEKLLAFAFCWGIVLLSLKTKKMLIDTHTHLYAEQFDEDRIEAIERAKRRGIEKFFLPNIDRHSIQGMLDLEVAFPGQCFAMMGLHPCSVKADYKEELQIVDEWLQKREFCAVGEIGIDLYWDKTFYKEQVEAFRIQARWAKARNLPIVIHSRESIDILIELLQDMGEERPEGIFHCFTGNLEQAQKIIDLGFYLGIGGVLTFKNSGLDKVIKEVPLDYLVLETDSPYLAPTPYRGKRNESAYIFEVAQKLALTKEVSMKEVEEKTSENAEKIFSHTTKTA
jgi:TatD DNase family protein